MALILMFAAWIAPWPSYGLPQESLNNPQRPSCGVIEERSKVEKPCIFPFSFRDITYTECTTDTDPDNKTWCSTKTDQNGVHVGAGGYWGYCPPECVQGSRGTTTTTTTTVTTTPTTTTTTSTTTTTTTTLNEIEVANIENFKKALNEIAEDDPDDILTRQNVRPKPSLFVSSCNCTEEKDCEWLSKLLELEDSIPKDHILRDRAHDLKSHARCAAFKVRCCKDEKIDQGLRTNDTPETKYDFPDDINLGTWKPVEKTGECGQRSTNENIVGGEIAQVVLGEHTLDSLKDCLQKFCAPPVQVIDVDEVVVHEQFRPRAAQVGYDIALVRMKELALLSFEDPQASFIAPVCLPWGPNDPGHHLRESDKLVVTGWGKVTNDAIENQKRYSQYGVASKTLQKLEVPGVPKGKCTKDPTYRNINTKILLCAGGEEGKDSCNGDSGGPLVYRKGNLDGEPWYQIGIVSFGTRECGIGSPAIYTRITAYLDWIAEHLKQ